MPTYVILDEDTLEWRFQLTGTVTDTIFYNSSATFDKGRWQLGKADFHAGVTPLSCRLRYLDVNTGSSTGIGGVVAGDERSWEASFYVFGSLVHTETVTTTETRPSGATFTLDDLRRVFTVDIEDTYITVRIPAQLCQWTEESQTPLSELYGHSPPYTERHLAWLPKLGETAEIEIEGVIGYTHPETITGAGWEAITLDEIADMMIDAQDESNTDLSLGAHQCTGDFAIIPKYNTNAVYSVSPTYSHICQGFESLGNSIGTVTATVDGSVRLQMVAPNPAAILGGAYGYLNKSHGRVSASIMPRRTYAIDGVLKAWKEAYPETLDVIIQETYPDNTIARSTTLSVSGGSFTHTASQDYWTISSSLQYFANTIGSGQSKTDSDTVEERASISARVTAGSLSARGEDASDIRMLFRGQHWDALSVVQAATQTVTSAFSAVAASNQISRTISTANGANAGIFGADYSNPHLGSMRYLGVDIAASGHAGEATRLRLGSKVWSKDTSGANLMVGTPTTIDLCNPDGTATVETQHSPYPLQESGGLVYSVDGALWGVDAPNNLTAIEYLDLVDGVTYSVGAMALSRTNAVLSINPIFNDWVTPRTDVTANTQWKSQFWRIVSNGKWHSIYSDGYRYDPSVYVARTILNIKTYYTGGNEPTYGVTVTDLAPEPGSGCTGDRVALSCWAHSGRYAAYLWGYGLTKRGAASWAHGIDKDITATLTVPAQMVFDALVTFPRYCGDVDGLTGTANASFDSHKMAAGWTGRGRAEGLTVGTNNAPKPAKTVRLTHVIDSAPAGSGVSDSAGVYQTGLNYVRGSREARADCEDGGLPYPSASVTFPARAARRIAYRLGDPVATAGIAYAVSVAGRHAVMWREGSSLRMALGEGVIPTFPSPFDTGMDGERPRLRWDKSDKRQRLYVCYVRSGSVYARYSTDEGTTWSSEMTIGTGTRPDFDITPDSRRWFYWRNGSSGIDYKLLDGADAVIENGTTNITSGVDDDDIAVQEFGVGSGGRRVGVFYRVSGTLTYKTASDGKTFS